MAYCRKCGSQIDDEAVVCLKCGVWQNGQVVNQNKQAEDNGSWTWFWLGFICPIIGLVLYLLWKDTKPNSAQKANMGSIIGFLVWVFGLPMSACVGCM